MQNIIQSTHEYWQKLPAPMPNRTNLIVEAPMYVVRMRLHWHRRDDEGIHVFDLGIYADVICILN